MLEAKRRKMHSTLTFIGFLSASYLHDHFLPFHSLSQQTEIRALAFTSVILFCRKVL